MCLSIISVNKINLIYLKSVNRQNEESEEKIILTVSDFKFQIILRRRKSANVDDSEWESDLLRKAVNRNFFNHDKKIASTLFFY